MSYGVTTSAPSGSMGGGIGSQMSSWGQGNAMSGISAPSLNPAFTRTGPRTTYGANKMSASPTFGGYELGDWASGNREALDKSGRIIMLPKGGESFNPLHSEHPMSGPEGPWASGYGDYVAETFNTEAAAKGLIPLTGYQTFGGDPGLFVGDPSKGRYGIGGDFWSMPSLSEWSSKIADYNLGSPFGSDVAGETIGTLLGIEGGDVSTVGDYAKTAMMLANPGMVVANKLWGAVGDVASGFQDAGSTVGQPGLMNLSSPEAQTGLRAGDVGGMSSANILNQPRTIRDVDVESIEQTRQNEYDAYMQEYTDYMNSLLVEVPQPPVPYQTTPRRTPMQTSSAWLTAENPMRGLGGIYG